MGAVKYGKFSWAWLVCFCASLSQAAAPEHGGALPPTRQQLIGAWRLVKIDYSGPSGPIVDPFYQADSTGLIVYDSSGWMSVHIVAPHRKAWDIPASRASSSSTAPEAQLKAAAFDTYYAYFGTWDLNEAKSTVTHHVQSSLIPAETGLSYTQTVTLEGGRLVFTVYGEDKGEKTVRRKVWERVTDH
jgi:Lipocalin-like domain